MFIGIDTDAIAASALRKRWSALEPLADDDSAPGKPPVRYTSFTLILAAAVGFSAGVFALPLMPGPAKPPNLPRC